MYLDSRDLIEERDELKEQVLNSFNETFPQYETQSFEDIRFEEEEIDSWKEGFQDEINEITCIDDLENEVSSSKWDHGITFISKGDFEDYCEEMVSDIGDLPSTLPNYIKNNINWEGVADDLKQDYSEVEFRGVNYLYRS